MNRYLNVSKLLTFIIAAMLLLMSSFFLAGCISKEYLEKSMNTLTFSKFNNETKPE